MNANVWLYFAGNWYAEWNINCLLHCDCVCGLAGYVRRQHTYILYMLYGTWEEKNNGRLKGFILLTQQ